MQYFSQQVRYLAYGICATGLLVSLTFAFTLGNYHLVYPYIVPSGNAVRLSGTTWTLFNRPWVLPSGSSASFTDTALALGVLLSLIPVTYVTYNNHRYFKTVERNIPRFMRDILESTNSGVILPRALIQASKEGYGPISNEIGIAMTKFSMGFDFKSSIAEACKKLKHPFMLQVGQIIIEAYSAGGKMHEVLESSVVLFNGIEQYDQQKQTELRPYTQLVYISVVIFLIIAYIIVSQFIGPLNNLPVAKTSGGLPIGNGSFSVGLSKIPPVYYESIFFLSGVLESIFGGIVVGKIVEASAPAGLRHSLALLTITIIVFNAPFIGIFGIA